MQPFIESVSPVGRVEDARISAWNSVLITLAPLHEPVPTQASQDDKRTQIPVTVLSGFLGAGKTTLLCRLLAESDEEIVAIVNDLASVNIDAMRIREASAETLQLENGCACCVLGNDLDALLTNIGNREIRPARIILEASGISDPTGLAQTIANNSATVLDGIITLIDSGTFRTLSQDDNVALLLQRQIDAAHLVAMTRTDGGEDGCCMRREIARIAPGRPVLALDEAPSPLSALVLGATFKGARPAPADAHHDISGFSSKTIRFAEPVAAEAFFGQLDAIPACVYRIKGWLRIRQGDDTQRHEVQAAGARWRTTHAPGSSDEDQLVIIGDSGSPDFSRFCTALREMTEGQWTPADPSPPTDVVRQPVA